MDGLIDGDAALGISSSTGGVGSSDMIEQAMAMFQSARPFASGAGHAGGGGQRPPPRRDAGRGTVSYRGGGGDGGRGRGSHVRGRGGRGRGRHVHGPGVNRPAVSAFMVHQGMRQLIGQFASEDLVHLLQQHNYLTMMQLDEETKVSMSIPDTIQSYHSICPLENMGPSMQQPSRVLPVSTLAMKAIHHGDGAGYMLRRVDGRHILPTSEMLDTWKEVVLKWSTVANHPNVVGIREAFVSEEMMDTPSLYLSFDYHPGACSLEQLYIRPGDHGDVKTLTEDDMWSFLVQMTSALRTIHSAGLDVGPAAFHPSKVLVCSPRRIRLGFLGMAEIILGPRSTDQPTAQLGDLTSLGSLLLTIACAAKNEPPSLEVMLSYYSRELCHIVAGLVASQKGNGFKHWRNLAAALGPRLFDELDTNQQNVDTMNMEMRKEIENGRIARFLIKLNTVVERAQFMGDTRWAETGDRYLLKLFRDFVFHQVDDDGHPVNDWGLVVDAINKADAGVNEKIILLSRDESSMLVVSYADIKRCLLAAYEEIKRNSKPLR